ncbi:MAG TPA: hypothetical protein VJT75_17050 [Thermoleophilaceae bacterium]|nr:hypothetical protein [Thermoleophilaceae bacterium]
MTIGTSLFLIAAGAILKYAVTAHVSGLNLHTCGLVLMCVGAVGLVVGIFLIVRAGTPDVPPPPARL